ncbi:MAG: ABC transporter ATP-binding protein [Alphaproteobacteria bacterium]|nr:ABC transporter ATP-binding protein [Alphaproteobacteria bacterium]
MSSYALKLTGINKAFGPVQANKDVYLAVAKGEIHGVIGENGAGKSTLMSILYGFYEADSGSIEVGGDAVRIRNSDDAIALGIGMVHQHFMLIDSFTVLENVMLGAESGPMLASSEVKAEAELLRLEQEYGLHVDLNAEVGGLPVGQQQRIEILKALYRGAEILILDEPTGVLTPQETDKLFEILQALKSQGVTILLITHKLREIMAVTDGVSVMRGGEMVAHRRTADTSTEELAELMVGRKVRLDVDKAAPHVGETLIQVDHLMVTDHRGVDRVKDVSFTVNAGEIVGVAGVSGNGQSELLQVLAGIDAPSKGRVVLVGVTATPESPGDPAQRRRHGVAHVPEDRHRLGLVGKFAAQETAILGYQATDAVNKGMFLDLDAVREQTEMMMAEFDVRPPDPSLKSANFSGGNQQKLILAREMTKAPKVLLVGQPTRGVDIGAIEFIHKQLVSMREAGCAVLLVSVELDEILTLSDRILVMCAGELVGEVPIEEADERTIGLMMTGVPREEAANAAAPAPASQEGEARV